MAEQFEEGSGHSVGSSMTQQQFIDVLKNLQRRTGTILRNFQDDLTNSFGLVAVDANGDPKGRSIAASNAALSVTNASGVSGNPTIGLGTAQLIREHLDTDWEDIDSNGATVTDTKHAHFLKFFSGSSNSVTLGPPPTSGKISRKILINNGSVNVTINESAATVFAAATSIVLGPNDAVLLYSDSSIKWHIASVCFHEGGTLTSGSLTVGNRYQILNYKGSDDFSNVGAATNELGVFFTATGTTPTDWAGASILKDLGAGVVNT